jgi:hypothetical protein
MAIIYPISPIDQYVIDFVRYERYDRQLTQAAVADILELGRGYIGNVESPWYSAKYNLVHINTLAWFWDLSPRLFLPLQAFDPDTLIMCS